MWGTQKPQGTYPSKRRFISTYCGKNDYFRAVATVLRSPSPRMRGTRGLRLARPMLIGLIPTYAGNTLAATCGRPVRRAHPHVCGEHNRVLTGRFPALGSSPRVWGAPIKRQAGAASLRLIPTCVGSTDLKARNVSLSSAHPHVCGEHSASGFPFPPYPGSSPRVWGAH